MRKMMSSCLLINIILCRFIVLYSYHAQDENDLSVERGQCVTVLNKVTISTFDQLIWWLWCWLFCHTSVSPSWIRWQFHLSHLMILMSTFHSVSPSWIRSIAVSIIMMLTFSVTPECTQNDYRGGPGMMVYLSDLCWLFWPTGWSRMDPEWLSWFMLVSAWWFLIEWYWLFCPTGWSRMVLGGEGWCPGGICTCRFLNISNWLMLIVNQLLSED